MYKSEWLINHQISKNPAAVKRLETALLRLPNVLNTEIVANQKTLEQKISDQGPLNQRIDPHILGIALHEVHEHRGIIKATTHPECGMTLWYSNAVTSNDVIVPKLNEIAPAYHFISQGEFPNRVGDALEIITHKCLLEIEAKLPNMSFLGSFDYHKTHPKTLRYKRIEPPQNIGSFSTKKIPDFYLLGRPEGVFLIECKNYREWLYPTEKYIKELIVKSLETRTLPVLIARRIHYTTMRNLLEPAGIIAHESYYQYYPNIQPELLLNVKDKRALGFSDVAMTEIPHARTRKFFFESLPKIAPIMAARFNENRSVLGEYAAGKINLAQLYNAIGSPAAGNWTDLEEKF